MSIGERIKARRKQLGMSAETLADRIGILWNDLKMYGYESISPGLLYLLRIHFGSCQRVSFGVCLPE